MKRHRLCAHRVLGVEDIRFSLLKAHRERLTVLAVNRYTHSSVVRKFTDVDEVRKDARHPTPRAIAVVTTRFDAD
jgi:hypothetical protein